ncbi:DUF294 nucleotidyltransferase-like domain-containing protein [Effusibacillus consociatus]|uniref:DUF294 nucleotidyltransferase-like domain-containing protein n=1 Tax=Effusibacillus consociatus TaxID=1117041 RepID=A0ABV9Q7P5_9BACL
MQPDLESMLTQIKNQVNSVNDVGELRAIHDRMPEVAFQLKANLIDSAEILSFVNRWHDKLTSRVIQLVLATMEQEGWGPPPSPFCWLLLGSGGRGEQTLQPDQDNAILYLEEQSGQKDRGKAYFQTLAERVVGSLAEIGYPYCPGYVMATNQRWNLSLSDWKQKVEGYLSYPDWDNVRFLMLIGDIRPLHGDLEIAAQFRDWFMEQMKEHSFVHWQIADHGLSHKVGLDFFDRFRVGRWGEHTGELNIKEGGYLQIVNATRLWSLAHRIHAASTVERIKLLRDQQVWKNELAIQVMKALHVFLRYRLWSNYVTPDKLSESEAFELKEAMTTARYLQKLTAKQFRKPK